jgi:hypothetical protein
MSGGILFFQGRRFMKILRTAFVLCWVVPGISLAAEPVYTAPAAPDSGCKSYDVSDIIKSIDANKDGKMSHEEWTKAKAPASAFEMLDRDKKGYVVPPQITASGPPPGMDTNHDCKITLVEMAAMDGKTPMPAGPPPKG